jgi:hypothetical protein
MAVKKIFISVLFLSLLIMTVVACNSTKNICPAYSLEKIEVTADPAG